MQVDSKNKVKKIIADKLDIDEDEITIDKSFIDDLGVDSLDQIEIIMEIEDTFDLSIPDEDIEKITTIKGLYDYLEDKI